MAPFRRRDGGGGQLVAALGERSAEIESGRQSRWLDGSRGSPLVCDLHDRRGVRSTQVENRFLIYVFAIAGRCSAGHRVAARDRGRPAARRTPPASTSPGWSSSTQTGWGRATALRRCRSQCVDAHLSSPPVRMPAGSNLALGLDPGEPIALDELHMTPDTDAAWPLAVDSPVVDGRVTGTPRYSARSSMLSSGSSPLSGCVWVFMTSRWAGRSEPLRGVPRRSRPGDQVVRGLHLLGE